MICWSVHKAQMHRSLGTARSASPTSTAGFAYKSKRQYIKGDLSLKRKYICIFWAEGGKMARRRVGYHVSRPGRRARTRRSRYRLPGTCSLYRGLLSGTTRSPTTRVSIRWRASQSSTARRRCGRWTSVKRRLPKQPICTVSTRRRSVLSSSGSSPRATWSRLASRPAVT